MLKNLGTIISFIRAIAGALPKVMEIVSKVEKIGTAVNNKRAIAMEMLEMIPTPRGWCEEDWRNMLGGLVDAAVAFLHWRGVFKHSPDHPCSKGGE